jgi:hypothetical protein
MLVGASAVVDRPKAAPQGFPRLDDQLKVGACWKNPILLSQILESLVIEGYDEKTSQFKTNYWCVFGVRACA